MTQVVGPSHCVTDLAVWHGIMDLWRLNLHVRKLCLSLPLKLNYYMSE